MDNLFPSKNRSNGTTGYASWPPSSLIRVSECWSFRSIGVAFPEFETHETLTVAQQCQERHIKPGPGRSAFTWRRT